MDNENKIEISEGFCPSCLSHIDTIQHISQLLTYTQGVCDNAIKNKDELQLKIDSLYLEIDSLKHSYALLDKEREKKEVELLRLRCKLERLENDGKS